MRYTVPYLPPPPTRAPLDTDELSGLSISVARLVGSLVRARKTPVDGSVLATALCGIFEPALRRTSSEAEIVEFVAAGIMLAKGLGLIDLTDDLRWRAVEVPS